MSTLAPQAEATPNQSAFHGVTARIIFCIFVLAAGLTASCVYVGILLGTSVGTRDFVCYWAAGKQLIHGTNPYSADAVLELEETAGYRAEGETLIMRNPPSALLLVIPLGLANARVGSILWSLLIFACLAGSIRMMWRMNGSPPSPLHLLGYVFAPALSCLIGGQTGIFALLGLVLFLRLHDSKPLLAGMALSLCALKPHLFLPFTVALFAWIVVRKAYRILAGGTLAIGVCCVIPLLFDPYVWRQYAQMARVSGIKNEFMPDIGTILRFVVYRDAMWLQFLPALVACLWALWYFHRHRADWDWQTHGSLLMLVSVLAAPYAWFTDQSVLLPALLHGLYSGKSLVAFLALVSAVLIQMIFGTPTHSALFAWPAVMWLVWYLWPVRCSLSSSLLPQAGEL